MSQPEHAEQVAVIQWWALACKGYGLPEFALYAVPNAAKRSYSLASYMKAEGMRKGIPDLNLDARSPRDTSAMGLRLEMKIKPNKPSSEQAEVLLYLRKTGYHAVVCWSADEAIRAIKGYLGIVSHGTEA